MSKILSLQQFFDVMNKTCAIRREIVVFCLNEKAVPTGLVDKLKCVLNSLETIVFDGAKARLSLDLKKNIEIDLTYEIEELKKDLFFLTHDEKDFYEYLKSLHNVFDEELEYLINNLSSFDFKSFISDRDGTVNNYCGRYASSIQSVYNAVFLASFAKKCVSNAVILTSAPLDNIGLVDLSVAPNGCFLYAGSKGREYFDLSGNRRQFEIDIKSQNKLNMLNVELSALVKQQQYEKFSLIGSGLQFKFGQTTIARQDISETIEFDESEAFLKLIKSIVLSIDPDNTYFRIEDTGKDIEIILTIDSKEGHYSKDFDKGDGVLFLDEDAKLELEKGVTLICGDTYSDLPMIEASMKKSRETVSVFVTRDRKLKDCVRKIDKNAIFVSEPDVLVCALNALAEKELF